MMVTKKNQCFVTLPVIWTGMEGALKPEPPDAPCTRLAGRRILLPLVVEVLAAGGVARDSPGGVRTMW